MVTVFPELVVVPRIVCLFSVGYFRNTAGI